ncbi:MAG: flagellar hook-associated protein FlgL [Nitrospiria bacterium]
MRISERMLFNSVMNRLQRQTVTLFKTEEQVSSGKKINHPSDDPIGQAQVLNFEKSLSTADQHLRNIDQVKSFLSVSETALQTVQNQLLRAHEVAVQMANATYTAADRTDAAREVRQIYDQLIAVANTTHAGQYIFAGNKVSTRPFVSQGAYIGTPVSLPVTITVAVNDSLTVTVDGVSSTVTIPAGVYTTGTQLANVVETAINGDTTFQAAGVAVTVTFDTDHLVITSNAVGATSNANITGGTAEGVLGLAAGAGAINRPAGTYLGDSAESSILIGTNTSAIKNLPGDRLFKGAAGGVDLLAAVGGLQVALENNDLTGIQTALGDLSGAQDLVNSERALLGARLSRIETTASMLHDSKFTLARLKSERVDVDLSRAISDLVQQQTILEATRATFARLTQRSLLDFLR